MNQTVARITILVDNKSRPGLVAEHGFSLWIEVDGRNILFDTGQGGALAPNAEALGINLREVDAVILSHGHYDHTGGLSLALGDRDRAHLYCHPDVVAPRYSFRSNSPKSIQMPLPALRAIDRHPLGHVHWVRESCALSGNVGIVGAIPRVQSYEDGDGALFMDPHGCVPDPFHDELFLWMDTPLGLVLITGCAHAGIVNILEHLHRKKPEARVHMILGGFHLAHADATRIHLTISALRKWDTARIVPCHCTGDMAVDALQQAFGGRVSPAACGDTFCFPNTG